MNGGTTILAAVEIYLEERRQLGFDLRIAGRQLMRFARYADARGHKGPLTLELQLARLSQLAPDTTGKCLILLGARP